MTTTGKGPGAGLGYVFFQRHPAEVAPDLLGRILVRQLDGLVLAGRIVETEAYSAEDPASHSHRGPTPRNQAMFGPVGRAYIYVSYGIHQCLNVSAWRDSAGGAVLIRAMEPLRGLEEMRRRRGKNAARELGSGPGKLAQALGVDATLYGTDLCRRGPLYIAHGETPRAGTIKATPRIGISRAREMPWRFFLAGNPCVSR